MSSATRFLDVLLIAAALFLACFCVLLFRSFNQAPPFEGPVGGYLPLPAFQSKIESCKFSAHRRILISGWIARPGQRRGKHTTTVVIRDAADGRFYAMKTDLPPRRDVSKRLNYLLGDKIDYTTSGFAASLNLQKAGHRIREGQLYIAYDEGESYTLVPTTCSFSGAR